MKQMQLKPLCRWRGCGVRDTSMDSFWHVYKFHNKKTTTTMEVLAISYRIPEFKTIMEQGAQWPGLCGEVSREEGPTGLAQAI